MDTREIKVLMVEPGKHPRVTTLKDDLDSLPIIGQALKNAGINIAISLVSLCRKKSF